MADDIQWITVNGVHIPVGKGESKKEAYERAFAERQKAAKKLDNKSLKEYINKYKQASSYVDKGKIEKEISAKLDELPEDTVILHENGNKNKIGDEAFIKQEKGWSRQVFKEDTGFVNSNSKSGDWKDFLVSSITASSIDKTNVKILSKSEADKFKPLEKLTLKQLQKRAYNAGVDEAYKTSSKQSLMDWIRDYERNK